MYTYVYNFTDTLADVDYKSRQKNAHRLADTYSTAGEQMYTDLQKQIGWVEVKWPPGSLSNCSNLALGTRTVRTRRGGIVLG